MAYMKKFRVRALDVAVDAVVFGAVIMIASPLGQLLEAIVDTVRYGHPR